MRRSAAEEEELPAKTRQQENDPADDHDEEQRGEEEGAPHDDPGERQPMTRGVGVELIGIHPLEVHKFTISRRQSLVETLRQPARLGVT